MTKCMYHCYLEDACQKEGIYAYPEGYRLEHLRAYVWCEEHKKPGNMLICCNAETVGFKHTCIYADYD